MISHKKLNPKMLFIYDLSEKEIKAIPFRVPDYTERRKKKKSSLQKEKESGYELKAKVKKPVKDPDPVIDPIDLLTELFSLDIEDYDYDYSSDIEKRLFFSDSQSNDYLFLDNEASYCNQ